MIRENRKVVVLGKASQETRGGAAGVSDIVGRKLNGGGLTND